MDTENKITQNNGSIKVRLDVYLFTEDDTYIAYSPALDLSGYGATETDAMKSFDIVMEEYIRHGLANRTLVKDLRAHGWKVKSIKQRKMSALTFDVLLRENDIWNL